MKIAIAHQPNIGPRDRLQLSAEVLGTTAELYAIESEWNELHRRNTCNSVFLTFDWLSHWWAHFSQHRRLAVITVRNRGILVGIAPLCISRQGALKLRRLGFLGDTLVGSDHLDFLVDTSYKAEVLQCLGKCIAELRSDWDYIQLADLAVESNAASELREVMNVRGVTINTVCSSSCPYTRLPGSIDGYWAALRPRFRKNLRYYARTLQRQGKLALVKVESPNQIERAFDDLIHLHEARSAASNRVSVFVAPRVRTFQREAALSLAARGWVRVYFLELDGRRIAALYGFSNRRTFSYYQSGADPAYSRSSAGSVLISFVMQDVIEDGHSEFDFLRGDESYKQLWATGARQLTTMNCFDQRAASRVAQAEQFLKRSLHECKAVILNTLNGQSATRDSEPGPPQPNATHTVI
ncbi:MAG TPA: GNAT family N-acetyltransferase [Candidatus Sulfotelmatobacter sp.]|nr:GNAT family N-acetyltransferase [Candidatus Sulfotelmatobacter sp.]